jgi:cyclopropane-fatty-acyl-phospholipid synthase
MQNTFASTSASIQSTPADLDRLEREAPSSARMIFKLLRHLRVGTLDVQFPDGTSARFGSGAEPVAGIALKDWSVCDAALKSGDIGFAETYMDGAWFTPSLPALLTVMIANRNALEKVIYGSWWGTLLQRVKHLLNGNTKAQARKNIQAHYDLGNDFYRLWLDDSMTYSSALFTGSRSEDVKHDLTIAQHAKYERVLSELKLPADAQVLEIGCGWAGFAEVAIKQVGAHVTGLTLSQEQLAFGHDRLARQGLAGQADLRLQDYRDEGVQSGARYDGIASIEMFEAVGERYWPSFFDCIRRNLKQGGRACIQTITIADELFDRYRNSTDFIQQYIFPGGMLPSPQAFHQQAARAGLMVINQLEFGRDYAHTLKLWRDAFMSRLREVRELGYDERFVRTWEFYLAYCEAAFAQGNTSVYQFTLQHSR